MDASHLEPIRSRSHTLFFSPQLRNLTCGVQSRTSVVTDIEIDFGIWLVGINLVREQDAQKGKRRRLGDPGNQFFAVTRREQRAIANLQPATCDNEGDRHAQDGSETSVGRAAAAPLLNFHLADSERTQALAPEAGRAWTAQPLCHRQVDRCARLAVERHGLGCRTCCNRHNGYSIPPTERVVKLSWLESNCFKGYNERIVAIEPTFPMHHGRLSLSFVGTLADRGSVPIERLARPADLAAWLAGAGLESADVPATPTSLRRAIRLREAIARIVAAVSAAHVPADDDVASLNAAARKVASIALDAGTLGVVSRSRDRVGAALGAIARDAIELLARPEERERLRTCAQASCGSVFLTPAGRRERRWCSMARCGNRAKVAAFRERADGQQP